MKKLFKNPSQIITVATDGKNFLRGNKAKEIGILTDRSIAEEDGKIIALLPNEKTDESEFDEIIDLTNKTVLPGLIDSHTHLVFAGSRADEFRKRLRGVSYEEIARRGGGILRTVNAVRNSSFEKLVEISKPKVEDFIAQGVTSLEIKSGYGLSFYDEIKLLQVINKLNELYEIDIFPTFLGAHTFPPEYQNDPNDYVELIIKEMLPYIAENKLAKFTDVFCEATAFSAKQTRKILEKAKELGFGLKLHTEQFNRIGGLEVALELGATSVDHLEVLSEEEAEKIAVTETVATLLPGVSFFLDYDYAPARKLLDAGAITAIATDYNPGSSHIPNLHLIMSIAALKMKITMEEIVSAVTINAAKALGVSEETGSIEVGKNCDLAIFNAKEFSEIIYSVGKNLTEMTVKNGKIIYRKTN
jgi:imidazolonepropionase